ncbi:MAG: lamin tail domain-containing protein [Christensenellales bacterium]
MRSSPRARPRRSRQSQKRFGLLLMFSLLLAGLIIVSPKEPTRQALNINAEGVPVAEHQGLVFSEIMSANASALPDEAGSFGDWLELWNSTDREMNLKDISLSNRSDKAKFIFPNFVLPADGRVVVFCDNTNRSDPGFPFHAKFKISSIAANLFLFDTRGHVMDSLAVPTLNTNEVYARQPDGSFLKGEAYTPGLENTPEGHAAYLAQYIIENGTLEINEVMPAPRTGLRDEDGDLSDWLELWNKSSQDMSLENLALSDDPDRPAKWVFPQGATVPAGGYYVVFCSGKDRVSASGFPHTNFSLAAQGETLTLSTKAGQLIDRVQYPSMPADRSYGRSPDSGAWQIFGTGTPGVANDAAGIALAEKYLRSLNPSGVILSEFISSNDTVPAIQGQPAGDWAEIYNAGDRMVDLSGWGLSDNLDWPSKWLFPQGVAIYPGEYKVILLDKSKQSGTNAQQLHASYAIKRAGGEVLTLSDAGARVLDRILVPEIPANVSYGRTAGKDGFFYFDAPTPGAANGSGFTGFAARPAFSKAGGLYQDNLSITITAQAGARIRYTVDGSIPTLETGSDYSAPIQVKDTLALRARAFLPGLQPSQPVTATYVMKTFYTLPVVCLTMDPKELWDPLTGIYATGLMPDGTPVDLRSYTEIPFKDPAPTYRLHGKEARPGYAEMFQSDTGAVVFSQGVAAGLIGQYSLDMPQKSLKVTAKAAYGSKYFNARLFEDRPFDSYKSFVLRVSGNDQVWTRMADGVQSRLADLVDTTVLHQAWRPVILYLNGQYWGQYNLRERVSRYFVAQHEGLPMEDADSVTILEANWKPYWGTNGEYRALIAKAKTLKPGTSAEDLQYLLDNVDVDNYFDYMILEAFFNNTDLGNIRYYKVPGGKWRWIMYDMDYGLFDSAPNGVRNTLNPAGMGTHIKYDNTLILKLLENAQMKDKYLRRFGEIFQMLTTDVMLRQIQECYDILAPEMPMHFERWAAQNLKSIDIDQPRTVDGSLRYWNTRVNRLRNVVRKRPTLCWEQVKEWFKLDDAAMIGYFGPKPAYPPETIL